MNIGIDIDGTITEAPELFSIITHALRRAGHKVFILSYRDTDHRQATEAELWILGIAFNALFLPEENDHVNMWKWKAGIANKLKLDVMMDDSPEVLLAMPTNVKKILMC